MVSFGCPKQGSLKTNRLSLFKGALCLWLFKGGPTSSRATQVSCLGCNRMECQVPAAVSVCGAQLDGPIQPRNGAAAFLLAFLQNKLKEAANSVSHLFCADPFLEGKRGSPSFMARAPRFSDLWDGFKGGGKRVSKPHEAPSCQQKIFSNLATSRFAEVVARGQAWAPNCAMQDRASLCWRPASFCCFLIVEDPVTNPQMTKHGRAPFVLLERHKVLLTYHCEVPKGRCLLIMWVLGFQNLPGAPLLANRANGKVNRPTGVTVSWASARTTRPVFGP